MRWKDIAPVPSPDGADEAILRRKAARLGPQYLLETAIRRATERGGVIPTSKADP